MSRIRSSPDGSFELSSAAGGIDRVLGDLLAIAFVAQAEGTWERLKACRAEDCGWAFFDRSRNRSGNWCTMLVCGSRAKSRAYRARRRR